MHKHSPCLNELYGMAEVWAPRTSICDWWRKAAAERWNLPTLVVE